MFKKVKSKKKKGKKIIKKGSDDICL